MAAHRVEKITDVPFEPAQSQPNVQVEEQVLQESFVQIQPAPQTETVGYKVGIVFNIMKLVVTRS